MDNLENKILASSPGLNIELVTVGDIMSDGEDYAICILGRSALLPGIPISSHGKEFIKELKKGDKLIIVRQEDLYLAAYGPIDESKLYTFGRKF